MSEPMLRWRNRFVAVDFDGTCVSHEFPKIGRDIGAVPVLLDLVAEGARLILHTMRSGKELDEAVAWFEKNGIPLFAVNTNPTQRTWTDSPKVYAHLYIDDAALGVPLLKGLKGERPFVDWTSVRKLVLPDVIQ